MQFVKRNKLILIILLVAAFLRFYNLGYSNFWYDETIIATAALRPDVSQAVKIARWDVASMPMDYVLVWLMGRVSLYEGWLRIPEALWGIAAVGIVFGFTRQAAGRFAATAAALFLALAQVHIYFSQELRFYAPLFFFYWLITWLLFRAQADPTRRRWILVIEAAVIGAYFHFYTLFAFFNGLIFLAIFSRRRSAWLGFFISGMITALCVLPGFLIFGLSRSMPPLPMDWSQLLPQLSIALGWTSITGNLVGNILGAVFLGLAIAGFAAAILRRNWALVGLAGSITFQVVIVIGMDVLAKYFFVTRSFLFALPITLLLAGYALQTLVNSHEGSLSPPRRLSLKPLLAGLILAGLMGMSIITYVQNQPIIKSNARPIAAYLHQTYQPGDQVWVSPSWEPYMYIFYLNVYFTDDRMNDRINGYEWAALPSPEVSTGRIFLLTDQLEPDQIKNLETLGFKPSADLAGPRWLWIHSN